MEITGRDSFCGDWVEEVKAVVVGKWRLALETV